MAILNVALSLATMEDLFGHIECRSKSDLIVMRILRSAMDKAHEKLQSNDGPIEFLHERSTFYELAAILVEGGLSIVQEETYILEGSSDKILSDLTEIRHWLQGRIRDMKRLIVQKDMELSERLANECKLREALELKERELGCLHETKIEPERIKNNEDEATDEGDISRLKSSVDQQVFNIKQKLEDEKKILTTERRTRTSRCSSPNLSFDFLDKEINGSSDDTCLRIERFSNANPMSESSRPNDQNVLIRRMSSDIDILKETLDLAFGRMHSVEVLPLEKQWRWTAEKDIESILVKGFITDLRGMFDAELKNRVGFLKESWSEFVEEMMKNFFTRNDSSTCSTVKRTVSEPLPDLSYGGNLLEDSPVDRSHHMAEVIKNHESIIRKHHQEWSWLTREVVQRERSSSLMKRDNDDTPPERRVHEEKMTIPEPDIETNRSFESLEVEIEGLKEERDMLCLQITVMEDFYELLFRGLLKDISGESCQNKNDGGRLSPNTCSYDHVNGGNECDTSVGELDASVSSPILVHYLESTIREDLHVVFFRETVKQWKEKRRTITSDDLKSCDSINQSRMDKGRTISCDDILLDSVLQEYIGSLLKEDIYMVFFREMAEAWKSEKDAFAIESLIRDDVYQFVVAEAVKDSHFHVEKPDDQEGMRRSRKPETDGEESLIQKLDSLLESLEAEEEDMMLNSSSVMKEHSENNSSLILTCEEMDEFNAIEWLETEDESTFSSVSEKLERALHQLYTSKEVLVELEQSLEVADDPGDDYKQVESNSITSARHEKARSTIKQEDDQVSHTVPCDNVIAMVVQLQLLLGNMEHMLHENLDTKCLRYSDFPQIRSTN